MKLSPDLERKCLELAGLLPAPTPSPEVRVSAPTQTIDIRTQRIITIHGLRLVSEANTGGGLNARLARKAAVKGIVRSAMPDAVPAFALPTPVKLIRLGTKRMDDDNLANAFKAVRDVIAEWLNVDDGDRAAVRWKYDQRPSYRAGIRIVIG